MVPTVREGEVWVLAGVWTVEEECTAEREEVVEVATCRVEEDITREGPMVREEDLATLWVKVSSREEDEELLANLIGNEVVTPVAHEVPVIDPPV
jgi:hypothetical protein